MWAQFGIAIKVGAADGLLHVQRPYCQHFSRGQRADGTYRRLASAEYVLDPRTGKRLWSS